MRRLVAIFIVLMALFPSSGCDQVAGGVVEPTNVIGGNGGPEKERRAALILASRFVETLDRGERITPMLSASLRAQASEDSLDAAFNGFRSWSGPFERRVTFAYGYSESVPDLPPGQYFTILFRSHFERGNVEEKVIVSVDGGDGGEASIAGYSQAKRVLYADGAAPPPSTRPGSPPRSQPGAMSGPR